MTREDETPATCHAPIDATVLSDYWLGLLPVADEETVEAHLFECDACRERLRGVIEMSDGLRAVARSGALRVVLGDSFVRRAEQTGQRVRAYDFAPGQTVPCTIAEDDDLLIARLAVDLTGVERVDIRFLDPQGSERGRLKDIPFRADAGHVIFQESAPFAKAAPSSSMVVHLLAVGEDDDERLLGEYFFQHTRTIPGPPGWEW